MANDIPHRVLCVLIIALLWAELSSVRLLAADAFVTTFSEFQTAVANASSGDTITMANGNWTSLDLEFNGFGSSTNPITLQAETPGQVILNGTSTLDISGDWLVVDGLKFEGGALSDDDRAIVEFRGDFGEATNSRFTNSAIIGYNPASVDDRYHWVELFGQNNRVDNNRFEDHDHSGVTVSVRRSDTGADYHTIDMNHFVDRPEPVNPTSSNGFETIRVGTSTYSLSDSFTTVENNLFERVDGEIEIISNKSGNNTYRYNTFSESKGTLTLRHGDNNLVEGNFFLGQDKDGSGGIRVIGEGQTIVNNYIANVDDRADGAISISAGVPNSEVSEYYQVKDAVIAHNTIVNTTSSMMTFSHGLGDDGRTLLAEDVTVANNIFRSDGPTIFEGSEGTGWTWEGNIAFGGGLGPKSGSNSSEIDVTNPDLQFQSDGVWRLSSTSGAINASVGDYSGLISDDVDGHARVGIFDVGADEYSTLEVVRSPLSSNDVGPAWLKTPDPNFGGGGGGCFASGCAIQAENFSAILDPDNDTFEWNVVPDLDALGGFALQAPEGSRTNVPGDTHDTIAVYELTFQQPGTYRAYYRAKGFSGSTDSIYVPDDFDVDPDNSESTSTNSQYEWESGDTFTISAGNVNVPLEFRIGRREEDTMLDALVLDMDLSLSDSELDALFDIQFAEADFNQDGFVDNSDLQVWESGHGLLGTATNADGDANGDGNVNALDYLIWQTQFTGSTSLVVNTAQVPEPGSVFLLAVAMLVAQPLLRIKSSLSQTQ